MMVHENLCACKVCEVFTFFMDLADLAMWRFKILDMNHSEALQEVVVILIILHIWTYF
jgi:hypothetical protein